MSVELLFINEKDWHPEIILLHILNFFTVFTFIFASHLLQLELIT